MTLLELGDQTFLIDAGISPKQMHERLRIANKTIDKIDGVFITHEHTDHVSGLPTLSKKYQMPIYVTEGTYRNLHSNITKAMDVNLFRVIEIDKPIQLNGSVILPFQTYHDALEPCGYKFIHEGKSLVYMTDTGYFPTKHYHLLSNSHGYIIESNHEPDLLLESNRPWILKRRILDDQGHLSNEDSAFLMTNVIGENTKVIVLAHLSEECNTETFALGTYQKVFENQGMIFKDYHIACAKQAIPLEEIIL